MKGDYNINQTVWLINEKKYGVISKHNIGYLDATKTEKGDFGYSIENYDNCVAFYPEIDFTTTARQLFEEMRFEYTSTKKFIYYENFEYDFTYIIRFDLEHKMITIKDRNGDVCLTENELFAIFRQMVELSWL